MRVITNRKVFAPDFCSCLLVKKILVDREIMVFRKINKNEIFLGVQQGPVMLTAKNLQCMRALLIFAHCHGSILGSSWQLVLTTIQVSYGGVNFYAVSFIIAHLKVCLLSYNFKENFARKYFIN